MWQLRARFVFMRPYVKGSIRKIMDKKLFLE